MNKKALAHGTPDPSFLLVLHELYRSHFFQTGLKAKFGRCCSSASRSDSAPAHWLDTATPRFGPEFVSDVKSVLSAAYLFLLYPPFWALFDQQSSKWTFQVVNGYQI